MKWLTGVDVMKQIRRYRVPLVINALAAITTTIYMLWWLQDVRAISWWLTPMLMIGGLYASMSFVSVVVLITVDFFDEDEEPSV